MGPGLVLGPALSAGAFLDSLAPLIVPEGLGAAGLGLGRLAAAPGRAGEVVVGVVALLLAAVEAGALLGRLRSAAVQKDKDNP